MPTPNDEMLRLKKAKSKAESEPKGEGVPFEDGPNKVLDEKATEIAQEMADKYGLEKLRKLFPDMAALLD